MVSEELPHLQSASMGIWVRAGSSHETPENHGISHLIEHMMFKGTASRSARQIAEEVDRMGVHINAFTGKEATCYYIKSLSGNLEKASEVVADMFRNSVFSEEELEKEKQVVYEEIKMTEDTPEEDAHEILDQMVFSGTELENCVIGTPESLAAISRRDILDYLEKEYTSEQTLVALAGSFREERMRSFFAEKLAGLATAPAAELRRDAPYKSRYRVKVKDVEQSHICLGLPGVSMEHPLSCAMKMLNNIMGGSMSSRLFQSVREEKGLAYAVYSGAGFYVNRGICSIYAGVAHQRVEEAVKAIVEELRLLGEKGVSEEELETAREQIKSSHIFGQENVNHRMFYMGKNLLLLGRVETAEEVLERLDRVTMEDVREAARLIAGVENYSGVLISNRDLDLEKIVRG